MNHNQSFSFPPEKVVQSASSLPFPVLLVDEHFTVVWSNQYLQDNLPGLDAPDSVMNLMKGYNLGQLSRQLQESGSHRAFLSQLPLVSTVLDFSPIRNPQGRLAGMLVYLTTFDQQSLSGLTNLEGAERVLTGFNAALRNPLSSIFLALGSASTYFDQENYFAGREALEKINQGCYQMLKSCNSIVEYSRYCCGAQTLRLQCVEVTSFFSDILFYMKTMLMDCLSADGSPCGVRLTWQVPQEPCFFTFDQDKIVTVLASLISNSCAFRDEDRPEGCTVHVTVSADTKSLRVTVKDNGVGIGEEVSPHIFEPYYSHGRDTHPFGGLGLGLPLSRMILSQHRGTLLVQSEKGEGATVSFVIPAGLEGQEPLAFRDGPPAYSSYMRNRFSPLHIFLSDVTQCPEL